LLSNLAGAGRLYTRFSTRFTLASIRFGPTREANSVGKPVSVRRLRQPLPSRPEKLVNFNARTVGVYRIAPNIRSFYAGHILYAWQEKRLRFHLTVHGYQWEPRLQRMASALKNAIDRCDEKPTLRLCSRVIIRAQQ
jgi:hypothetical protein